MASKEFGFSLPPFKRSKTVDNEVMKQGKAGVIPWEDIMPYNIVSWLENYAYSIDSTKEILLASILPSVATLMGQATVRVPSKLFPENIKIFMVCLCEPGAGKSPAFQHGCQVPLRLHVEQKNNNLPLFVDDFTEKGLFKQLGSATGGKAIIGKEEVSQFFERVLGTRETSIDMERLINLYDGATWLYSKGDKTARQIIDKPGVSIAGFSQPERFFPLYRRMLERKDGAVDRLFVYQPMPHRCLSAERKAKIAAIQASPLKDLRLVYEYIYDCYHPDGDVPKLQLSDEAVVTFEEYTDQIANRLNSHWEEGGTCVGNESKRDRHVLRVAVVLHVFMSVMAMKLNRRELLAPPSENIADSTVKAAIKLVGYFKDQMKILEQLNEGLSKDQQAETIYVKVITHKGPFVTVQSVQRSFSGKNQRPSADDVVGVFKAMEEDALGKMKGIEKTSVFFKALPSSVTPQKKTEEKLERYNVGLTTYFNLFTELCSTSQISKEQFNKFFDKAKEKDALRKDYFIEPYDLDE